MADLPPYPGSNGNTGDDTGSTPRWVKVFGIIALALVLLFVILMLTGHGPGRHTP
jgi:hypothetical protein